MTVQVLNFVGCKLCNLYSTNHTNWN